MAAIGAYGGFFMLTERGHDRLSGIELADSITVDAHKAFLPFGIGGLLVRHTDVADHDLRHFLAMWARN